MSCCLFVAGIPVSSPGSISLTPPGESELKRLLFFDEYLKPTRSCDSNNKFVKYKTRTLTKNISTPAEQADKLREWIKKGMCIGIGSGAYWDAPASENLPEIGKHKSDKKYGRSFNWANTLIAMARSINIPARYRVTYVKKEAFKHLYSPAQFKAMEKSIPYISGELYIDGAWKENDIFRDHRYDVAGKSYVSANIDDFARAEAKKKTREQCDDAEQKRKQDMVAKGGKENISLFH